MIGSIALADRGVIRSLLDEADPAALIAGWVHVLVDIDAAGRATDPGARGRGGYATPKPRK